MIPQRITIVGGGTAGWMSACLMAHHWQKNNVAITVVESNAIGTIGVGEGSTPFLRQFFNTLGIQESTWMAQCDATYKCGIAFPNWCSEQGPDTYFHPFYSEIDSDAASQFFMSCQQRKEGFDAPTLPDDYFLTAYLANQHKSPANQTSSVDGVDYGYHFDAAKLGHFLAAHAKQLGVVHIDDKVIEVNHHHDTIVSLQTEQHGKLSADMFIDCSGLSGLLIQQTLGETLIDYQDFLPNNRAVAIATNQQSNALSSYTSSKALDNGWMWSIPLQSRIGNGYVYSSQYLSAEKAEQDLRNTLGEHHANALHLAWQPGRISQHWRGNCLAIGLSQGFLEPLEAPMLNLVQQTCEAFIEYIGKDQPLDHKQQTFNDTINRLIDGTRDYLQAHYLLNTRTDSEYWRDAQKRHTLSPALFDILSAWKQPGKFEATLQQHRHSLAYGKTSWYCLLAGMGYFEDVSKPGLKLTKRRAQKIRQHCLELANHYTVQATVLQQRKLG